MSVEWVELVACHNRRSEEKEGNDDKQRKYQRDEEKGGSKKRFSQSRSKEPDIFEKVLKKEPAGLAWMNRQSGFKKVWCNRVVRRVLCQSVATAETDQHGWPRRSTPASGRGHLIKVASCDSIVGALMMRTLKISRSIPGCASSQRFGGTRDSER